MFMSPAVVTIWSCPAKSVEFTPVNLSVYQSLSLFILEKAHQVNFVCCSKQRPYIITYIMSSLLLPLFFTSCQHLANVFYSLPLLHRTFPPQVCQCPLCKKTFQKRPELQVNRTLREITEQFRSMKKGGGLAKEKKGGTGNGDIRDFLIDELRRKLPKPMQNVPVMPVCDSEGKLDWDSLNYIKTLN